MKHIVRGKKSVIVLPVYARPEYLLRCLNSLSVLIPNPWEIIAVNDASVDPEIERLLKMYCSNIATHPKNTGVRGAIKTGCTIAFEDMGADLVIVLDSDAIVKPNMVFRLVEMHEKYGNITSGFNTHNIKNPIEETGDGCVFKKHVNGINVCFDHEQYDKYVAPSLEIIGNWDYTTSLAYQKDNKLFTITAPSLVQHIGLISSMGHTAGGVKPDMAYDFD